MQALHVAFSQLKVMSTNLWVLWLMAWAPSSSVGLTVPEHECIESFDLAFNNWRDCKLDTEFALPIKDNFVNKTKVRLMRLASRLRARYGKSFSGGTISKLARPSNLYHTGDCKTRFEVEVKEAVATSATGLGRPGIQTIHYQVLGEATVKAASADRFEASAEMEALDRGSDSELAEAAAVVKSQMARVCKKNESKGFGLFATNNWTSHAYECAEIIDVDTVQDCLHYTDCVSLERTLSTAGMQFYHPANILFVDGTGLKGGKSAYRSISFLPQQFIRYVNSSQDANATYRFFHNGVMLKSMRQHLIRESMLVLLANNSGSVQTRQVGGKDCRTEENQTWRRNYIRLPARVSRSPQKRIDTRYSCVESEVCGGCNAVARTLPVLSSLCKCFKPSSFVSSSRFSYRFVEICAAYKDKFVVYERFLLFGCGSAEECPVVFQCVFLFARGSSEDSPVVYECFFLCHGGSAEESPVVYECFFLATVVMQKKAASSRTSRSAPDNLSQAKRANILSQPWLCDQKTLLVSVLTKYQFLDNKSKEVTMSGWPIKIVVNESISNLPCHAMIQKADRISRKLRQGSSTMPIVSDAVSKAVISE
eukprot:g60401.t1